MPRSTASTNEPTSSKLEALMTPPQTMTLIPGWTASLWAMSTALVTIVRSWRRSSRWLRASATMNVVVPPESPMTDPGVIRETAARAIAAFASVAAASL
ncbi:hypothetical protein K4X33_16935 [Brevibacterium casei]|nr:hypothetical protein K4X33_16935 [Brevibacterium casei]